jgi:hypothetical protein
MCGRRGVAVLGEGELELELEEGGRRKEGQQLATKVLEGRAGGVVRSLVRRWIVG